MFRNKIRNCGEDFSAKVKFGNAYYGDVNINQRIHVSKGKVILNDDLNYDFVTILPYGENDTMAMLFGSEYTSAKDANVTATIDGKEYTGQKIIVEGKKITVDDELVCGEAEDNRPMSRPRT